MRLAEFDMLLLEGLDTIIPPEMMKEREMYFKWVREGLKHFVLPRHHPLHVKNMIHRAEEKWFTSSLVPDFLPNMEVDTFEDGEVILVMPQKLYYYD